MKKLEGFINYCSNVIYYCSLALKIHKTSDEIDDNRNIIFNRTKFPKEMYAQHNYIIVNSTERKLVNQYAREYLCLNKPFIRFCCYSNETNSIAPPSESS